MSLRFKTIPARLFLLALFLGAGATGLFANPYEQITSDQKLYQRVKKLGDYGLLDPGDKAVLDEGKVVTKMELAFYTEKAKARISAPQLGQPLPATPTPVPFLQPASPDLMTLPPALLSTPTPMPVFVAPGVRSEIDELLKELRAESAALRTRLALNDERLKGREDEIAKLKPIQDEVDSVWKKANKSGGIPHFNTKSYTRFENFHLSGIATENASRAVNEIKMEIYTDLGGKGAIDVGFTGQVSSSNSNAGAVSLAPYAPAVNFILDGSLGRWDTNFAVEAYKPDTTLGDFTRGISPTSIRRFERPFEVKNFSDDKDTKIWDDYMDSIGFVATASVGAQSTNDRVFDGLFMTGTNLPLVSKDAKINFLVGRMGTSATQTQRWEEALKYSQPFANGLIRTSVATQWVNDNFGTSQPLVAQLDLKCLEVDLGVDLKPFYLSLEWGGSYFRTGLDLNNLSDLNPKAVEAGAGLASLSCYPFTVSYQAISDDYANFQSKVMMSGFNLARYGVNFTPDHVPDVYGAVGEVDNLISDRYGWKVNLGWNGRKQDWMKSWPSFLDNVVVNFDVAQKTEYSTVYSPAGYNVIEPVNMLTFYYPDDEGLWGLNFWGGYSSPAYSVRNSYIGNIQGIRNDTIDPLTTIYDVRYQFQMTSERIPLILPVPNENVVDVNGRPVTVGSGFNSFINLTHLKSYNYITLTTKLKLNKMLGMETPFYGAFFFTDNRVSGKATDPTQTDIPSLFDQTVYDGTLMIQALKNLNLSGELGMEYWKCDYTYPLIDYRTDSIGAGLSWDIPWGGAKWICRYKHLIFHSANVAANSYEGDQVFSQLYFVF